MDPIEARKRIVQLWGQELYIAPLDMVDRKELNDLTEELDNKRKYAESQVKHWQQVIVDCTFTKEELNKWRIVTDEPQEKKES